MKNSLLFVLSLLFLNTTFAQITVTNAVFASAGDDLKTRQATSFGSVSNITASGPNQTWDYTSITGGDLTTYTVTAAASGVSAALFPDGNIILPDNNLGGDNYIKVNTNSMEVLGFAGDFLGIGVNFPVRFDDARTIIETPLTYQTTYTDNSDFLVALKLSDITQLKDFVDSLLMGTGIVVDSLRVTYSDTTYNDVDAWGTLTVPETGTFNVLRLRQETHSYTKIEMRGSLGPISFGWTDPSDVPGAPPIPFGGSDTTLFYNYFNDVAKEPIAVCQIGFPTDEPTRITNITYKSDLGSGTTFGFAAVLPSASAFPNPAVETLNIKLRNFDAGDYEVKLYNVIGRELMSQKHSINGDENIKINVANLNRGTYLYSIIDSRGNTILTKRVMVARP